MGRVFVGLGVVGLILSGLVFSIVQADDKMPLPTIASLTPSASPNANPSAIAEYIANDSATVCDHTAIAVTGNGAVDESNPHLIVCFDHDITAYNRCLLDGTTAALQTMIIDCVVFLTNPERVSVSVDPTSVYIMTGSGKTYPYIGGFDDPVGTTSQALNLQVHAWPMRFGVPQGTELPLAITFDIGPDHGRAVFVIETLVSLPE